MGPTDAAVSRSHMQRSSPGVVGRRREPLVRLIGALALCPRRPRDSGFGSRAQRGPTTEKGSPPGPWRQPGASGTGDYLQPGVVVVWPGGWHLALASFGPPPLLPGPKDGSAIAAGASAPSTVSVVKTTAIR